MFRWIIVQMMFRSIYRYLIKFYTNKPYIESIYNKQNGWYEYVILFDNKRNIFQDLYILYFSTAASQSLVELVEPSLMSSSIHYFPRPLYKTGVKQKRGQSPLTTQLWHYENIAQFLQIILNLHINSHHCFGVKTLWPGPGKTKQQRNKETIAFPLTADGLRGVGARKYLRFWGSETLHAFTKHGGGVPLCLGAQIKYGGW